MVHFCGSQIQVVGPCERRPPFRLSQSIRLSTRATPETVISPGIMVPRSKSFFFQNWLIHEILSRIHQSAPTKLPLVSVGFWTCISKCIQKVCEIGPSQLDKFTKKRTKCDYFFIFAQKSIGPVLIESSSNSTMPTYPEHLLTPSELGDMVHFS